MMRHASAFGAMAVGLVALAAGATARGAPGMKTVEVVDPLLGGVAYRVTIPAGWLFDGAVLRPHFGPMLVFRVSTPDGLTGLQRLPRYDWVSTTDPSMRQFYQRENTMQMPPQPAGDFMKKYVLAEARPGVSVIGNEPMPLLPKLVEADQAVNAQYAAQAAPGARPQRQTTDGSRVRISYIFNKHQVEETIAAVIVTTEMPAPRGITHLMQATVVGVRAPKGRLDAEMPQLTAVGQSIAVDPAWSARQNRFAAQSAQAQQAAILKYGHDRLEANRQVFERSMENTARMEKVRSGGARATADHMADQQDMVDPATGRTGKVSNQFNHSYVDQSGNVVHTNSATYNPNAELRGNWTQLQPLKP